MYTLRPGGKGIDMTRPVSLESILVGANYTSEQKWVLLLTWSVPESELLKRSKLHNKALRS